MTDPTEEIRAEVATRLADLTTALVAHGFSVLVERKFWMITATHRADKTAPKRSTQVQLAPDDDGHLCWYGVVPDTREVKLIGAGEAIAEVVERIARELRSAVHR